MRERDIVHEACWVLCRKESGVPIRYGNILRDFRGRWWEVVGGRPPRSQKSVGRVTLNRDGVDHDHRPCLVGLEWRVEI